MLIGGVGAGTVLTLLFLPALYAIWFKVKKPATTNFAAKTHRPNETHDRELAGSAQPGS